VLTGEAHTATLHTLVGVDSGSDVGTTRVEKAKLLVLAVRSGLRAIIAEVNALDDATVALKSVLAITSGDIPKLDVIVLSSRQENVLSGGVELANTNLALVTLEDLDGLVGVLLETTLGDLPNLSEAVLRGGGEDAVVEGVEVKVENGTLVTGEKGDGIVATEVSNVKNTDGTSTTNSPGNSEVLLVGDDVVRIPSGLGELDTLINLVPLGGRGEDVTVFGGSHKAAHGCV
jgi:hypothetical protein